MAIFPAKSVICWCERKGRDVIDRQVGQFFCRKSGIYLPGHLSIEFPADSLFAELHLHQEIKSSVSHAALRKGALSFGYMILHL